MKIKRFEQINELRKNIPISIKNYIENFDGCTDEGIISWIQYVAKDTNLKEYINIYNKEFQEEKKLTAYNKFIDLEKKLNDAEGLVYKLQRSKEKLEINAKSEILYKFQEDLLENDPSSFYKIFIEENYGFDYWDCDIHPNIKKKYKEKLDLLISAKKYNL